MPENKDNLIWKKYPVLNDGFICLVDVMGDDSAIVQAARVSYGKDARLLPLSEYCFKDWTEVLEEMKQCPGNVQKELYDARGLIRRLMHDSHTSPFEMVEFKFKIRVPMDCWRQWIRHRTANVNEYSTRYSEAIDSQQTTSPEEWRLQAKDNKQGSKGLLTEWPPCQINYDDELRAWVINGFVDKYDLKGSQYYIFGDKDKQCTPGQLLTQLEDELHEHSTEIYNLRLYLGVAREQARKDLPLSTYTEAYWKCDLHNIFNFLRLRLDPHAQLEIRLFANAMYEIIKQVCPVACEAFEDYILQAKKFSRMEMVIIRELLTTDSDGYVCQASNEDRYIRTGKPLSMTDSEWKCFLEKLN